MLIVSNKYEAATMVLSWHMYDQLWELMTTTGLVYLPFFMLVFRNFVEPITTAYTTSASHFSLKKMEMGLIQALIVIVIAGQPLIALKLDQIAYFERCSVKAPDGSLGDSVPIQASTSESIKTNFSNASFSGKEVWVPLWWYAVYSFSTGFTEASKTAVPCIEDARGMLVLAMQTGVVRGGTLQDDLLQFTNQCWMPAKAKADAIAKTPSLAPLPKSGHEGYAVILAKENAKVPLLGYGSVWDTDWVGSWTFVHMSNHADAGEEFYGKRIKITGPGYNGDTTCSRWWYWADEGDVREPIYIYLNQVKEKIKERVKEKNIYETDARKEIADEMLQAGWFKGTDYARDGKYGKTLLFRVLNEKISEALKIEQGKMGVSNGFITGWYRDITANDITRDIKSYLRSSYNPIELSKKAGTQEKSGNWLQEKTFNLGLQLTYFGTIMLPYVAGEVFPIIQALLTMGVCMLLGVGLVFSGYDFQKYLIEATVALFTLKFLGFLLYFCQWLDNNLIYVATGAPRTEFWDWYWTFWDAPAMDRVMVDYATAGFYFTLPALFVGVMAWTGHQAANVVADASQKMGQGFEKAGQAGQQAMGGAVSSVVGSAANAVAKAVNKKIL